MSVIYICYTYILLIHMIFLMKYHKSLGVISKQTRITSITMAMILVTMTIALGPLNLLQVNSASAQNQVSPDNSQMAPGANSNQMSNASNPNSSQINSAYGGGNTGNASNPNGSISILSPIINGFKALMGASLIDAIRTAQDSVGSNSTTVAAFIHPSHGFIVYDTFVLDANNNLHKIVIDPANGRILISEPLSLMELLMMAHGGNMGFGPGMDNGMMMGPGMMLKHGGNMDQGW